MACLVFAGSVSELLRVFSVFKGIRKFPGLCTGGPSPLMLLKEALIFVTVFLFRNKNKSVRLCSRGIVLR